MNDLHHQPWPEVAPPLGWKKNPQAGNRLSWILILTVAITGVVSAITGSRSAVLQAVCFLALVALPFAGPLLARTGRSFNDRSGHQPHPLTKEEMKLEPLDGGLCLTRVSTPHQKLILPDEVDGQPVTAAKPGLFKGNGVMAFVHLPQGLEAIPEKMFADCSNLPAIVIPPAVKKLGSRAFHGCRELKDVYLPFSVEEIAPDAFSGCGPQVLMHVRPGSPAEALVQERGFLSTLK